MAKKLIADLDFSWTKALVTSWLAMLGIFAVMYAIFRFVPPVIRISQKGVSRQHGQAVRWRQRHDIRLITLDWTDPSAPRLQVETESKPLAIGIGPKIDRTLLVTFLRQTFPELLVQETL